MVFGSNQFSRTFFIKQKPGCNEHIFFWSTFCTFLYKVLLHTAKKSNMDFQICAKYIIISYCEEGTQDEFKNNQQSKSI
jgi:hypothetical protein